MEIVALVALIIFLYWREESQDDSSQSMKFDDTTEIRK